MFRKRSLTISRPQHEVERIFRAHGDIYPPKDEFSDFRFALYKHVKYLWFIRIRGFPTSFRFAGSCRQSGSNTEVTYRVSPGISTYFYILLLTLLPIGVLNSLNSNGGSYLTNILGCILLDSILGGIIILFKNLSIRDFEDLLTGKAGWDSRRIQ